MNDLTLWCDSRTFSSEQQQTQEATLMDDMDLNFRYVVFVTTDIFTNMKSTNATSKQP